MVNTVAAIVFSCHFLLPSLDSSYSSFAVEPSLVSSSLILLCKSTTTIRTFQKILLRDSTGQFHSSSDDTSFDLVLITKFRKDLYRESYFRTNVIKKIVYTNNDYVLLLSFNRLFYHYCMQLLFNGIPFDSLLVVFLISR